MPTPDGQQFSRFTRTTTGGGYLGTSSDTVRHDQDGDIQRTVDAPFTRRFYEYRPNPAMISVQLMVKDMGGRNVTTYPKNYKYSESWAARRAEPSGQIPLFTHESEPGTSTAALLAGTKDSRMQAMHLVALADVDTQVEKGRSLIPDTSLSPRSQRLVSHLEERGATTLPEQYSTNKIDFTSAPWPSTNKDPDHVFTKEETKVAKGHLRNTLRPAGKQNAQAEPDYEQLQLDLK